MFWPVKMFRTLGRWVDDLSPGCRRVARLQSEALDHPLPLRRRLGLRLHLLFCKWCGRYGKQISFLRTASHHETEHDRHLPPQDLSPGARERIKQALRSKNGGGTS
jgi:hypothetical protein